MNLHCLTSEIHLAALRTDTVNRRRTPGQYHMAGTTPFPTYESLSHTLSILSPIYTDT